MQRVCFILQVKPDRIEEYKERHRRLWPEMQAALRETDWSNYSLFLREDGLLVARDGRLFHPAQRRVTRSRDAAFGRSLPPITHIWGANES
jgi:hypothetical protein